MDRIVTTKFIVGIAHMQVCAAKDATDEEILEHCNRDNPAGTTGGWSCVYRTDDEFWGKVGPVQCADDQERTHFLVAC